MYEGDSAIDLCTSTLGGASSVRLRSQMSVHGEDFREEVIYLENAPLEVLNKIIADALDRLHIDVDETVGVQIPLFGGRYQLNFFRRAFRVNLQAFR